MASLALKLILTLYMGKYLGLSEMGTYGLVAAAVTILISMIGFRFDYAVTREIVDIPEDDLVSKMRDQAIFYSLNYALLIIFGLVLVLNPFFSLDREFVLFVVALSILENFAAITAGNLVSLKKPIFSNLLFFTRSALWVVPLVILGLLKPEYRNAETVFCFWLGGIVVSLIGTFIHWRPLPWQKNLGNPVRWNWIVSGLKKSIPVWIGAVSASAASNLDRFVVEHFLNRDFVGIASFYGSFVVAIASLLTSGIFAFGYPHLITLHRNGEAAAFMAAARKMGLHAMFSAGVMAIGMGVVIPVMGNMLGRPEFSEQKYVLWLLLLGAWLKAATEHLYYVLYARHQDREIWIGSFIILIPALGFNLLLVPLVGFIGIGFSAVLSSLVLCAWRIYSVKKPHKEFG